MPSSPPLPPVILIRGNEQLLVDREVTRIVAAAHRHDPGTERREASSVGLTVGEFGDMIAASLFAEPRVVIMRDVHEATKDLGAAVIALMADPADDVTFVLQHGGGVRNKNVIEAAVRADATVRTCEKITRPAERRDFVRGEIKAAGGTSTPDAVDALVAAVGTDIAELASVASQLVADTGGMVDEGAVRRYYRGRADINGFAVADLVVAGDVAGALEHLRWALVVGEHPVRIADALATGIRHAAIVADQRGSNARQVAAQWGMPPWKVDKIRTAARGWSAAGLTQAMVIVARLNANVKGGAADAEFALERGVLTLGRLRSTPTRGR